MLSPCPDRGEAHPGAGMPLLLHLLAELPGDLLPTVGRQEHREGILAVGPPQGNATKLNALLVVLTTN